MKTRSPRSFGVPLLVIFFIISVVVLWQSHPIKRLANSAPIDAIRDSVFIAPNPPASGTNDRESITATNSHSLTGDDAKAELRKSGQYESLAKALSAARHAVEKVDCADADSRGADYFAANPGQQLRAWFSYDGVELASGIAASKGRDPWSLGLHLRGIGRDGDMKSISAGSPSSSGNRVEIAHSGGAIIQWFENQKEGLEQGFTIRKPPGDGTGEVTLVLQVEGSLQAVAMDSADGLCFVDASGAEVIHYAGLKAWDAAGKILKARMETRGDDSIALIVVDEGAAYPLTIDPIFANVEATLLADSVTGDFFGSALALDGDTLLVGVTGEDLLRGENVGSVYVYVWSGSSWIQKARLVPEEAMANDTLGYAIALSGDTAVIGNPNADEFMGSAYIFTRTGGIWSETGKLSAQIRETNANFGSRVAISGDLILIGAYGESNYRGAAYSYSRNGDVWVYDGRLVGDDSAAGDVFGSALKIDGQRALISAGQDDEYRGSTYVFVRNGAAWVQETKLVAGARAPYDSFGSSVDLLGDMAVIGATGDDSYQGAAYVFERIGGVWTESSMLTEAVRQNDYFGGLVKVAGGRIIVGTSSQRVIVFEKVGASWIQQHILPSFSGDIASDGSSIYVASPYENTDSGTLAGVVRIYGMSAGSWVEKTKLESGDGSYRNEFGSGLGISGEIVAVGSARADTPAGVDAGCVYVFQRDGGSWNQVSKLFSNDASANDYFGASVAIHGETILVGAPLSDPFGLVKAGVAYVFEKIESSWVQQAKLIANNPTTYDSFGQVVALGDGGSAGSKFAFVTADGRATGSIPGTIYLFSRSGGSWIANGQRYSDSLEHLGDFGNSLQVSGDILLVGSPGEDQSGFGDVGCTYVFKNGPSGWSRSAKLLAADGTGGDRFGTSVGVEDGVAAVGAPGDDGTGSVYTFSLQLNGDWIEDVKLNAIGIGAGDSFGAAVGISNGRILVGAPGSDSPRGIDTGRVHLFSKQGELWNERLRFSGAGGTGGDQFGQALALEGDLGVVAVPGDSTRGFETGRVDILLLGELPEIVVHPSSQTVPLTDPGTPVVFSVIATGYGPLQYQWRKNGSSIAGATSSSYTIPAVLVANQGDYDCVVSNIGGIVTSAPAKLSVNILSQFTQASPGASPDAQGFVIVTLSPSGVGRWRFTGEQQWRPSGIPVSALTTGDRNIEFQPVPGYIQPPLETISVISGGAATLIERVYYETPTSGSGGLSVSLKPVALTAASVPQADRAQWRLLGEDDTQWRDSDAVLTGLLSGNYLVECKPVADRTTPSTIAVLVQDFQTAVATLTYFLADAVTGTPPGPIPFETISTDTTKPYAHVGQIRSNVGSSSGFVVKQRVIATAGHVVFDDGTLSAVSGLQWLFQRHRGTYEPKPQIPRGYYIFDGYASQRALENTPGSSSPLSQNLDVAALYFLEDAGRGGYGGFLASDAMDNEFLLSSAQKMLVGYPVDGITASNQGRMHATPPANVAFTRAYGRTFTTPDIRSRGGMSGGPLCVQFESGNYYPAAIYLGGTGQTVVRSIDSQVIDLFARAEVSGNGGDNNTGGGITHTGITTFGAPADPGSIKVTILPTAAAISGRWGLKSEPTNRSSGSTSSDRAAGDYILQLTTISGFQVPAPQTVRINGGQLTEITFTYAADAPPPTITSASSASGTRGQSLTYQIVASQSPTSYAITGSLPTGLTFNTSTGMLGGTLQQAGVFIVTLAATNAGGTGTKTLVLTSRPSVSNQSATAALGQPMSRQIASSESGADLSYTANDLPSGTSLDEATGLITGSPSQAGVFNSLFTVTKGGASASAILSLTVTATALDVWRLANFQTTSNTADAADNADPDSDGSVNRSEYAAGTNPNSAADVFKILTSTKNASTITVTAAGRASRSYVLERRATLDAGPWTTVTSIGPLASDGPVTLTESSATASAGFYRIRVFVP